MVFNWRECVFAFFFIQEMKANVIYASTMSYMLTHLLGNVLTLVVPQSWMSPHCYMVRNHGKCISLHYIEKDTDNFGKIVLLPQTLLV